MSGITETEIIFYAKLGEPSGLESAFKKEHHTEYHLFSNNAKLRSRSTDDLNSNVKHELTIKDKKQTDGVETSNTETNKAVDEGVIDIIKRVAEFKIDKTRYFFKSDSTILRYVEENEHGVKEIEIPNLVYEVDVFKDKDQNPVEFVKIEIEIDQILTFLTQNYPDIKNLKFTIKSSNFPIKPYRTIVANSSEQAEEFEKHLWDEHFKLNPVD